MRDISAFKKTVKTYYRKHRRDLPWRPPHDALNKRAVSGPWPYRILISEIMLQQTQVERVLPKYEQFIKQFPSFEALANASTADVIRAWQGLGYNRRALALKRAAEVVVKEHGGVLPSSAEALVTLPGIGTYTAGALLAFVWNKPTTMIETNIRNVFIHHFFPRSKKVSDAKLLPLIEAAQDTKHPRDWYYALMDYGSFLKRTVGNATRSSTNYKKQSRFKGSRRELRGHILRELTVKKRTIDELYRSSGRKLLETRSVLDALIAEGLIEEKNGVLRLAA
jgi:A/G-specific adenine glycosylase